MTHPVPEALIRHILGAGDLAVARHIEDCSTCRAEVARLREAAVSLRAPVSLERLAESADCPEELILADFVDGRLGPETRGPVVAHLLTCARCRSLVRATGRVLADASAAGTVPGAAAIERGWRRWSLPLGIAAAAAVALLLWPRGTDDTANTGLREPADTGSPAPMPIAPRALVARVDQFVWSSVPRAERYRLRLYNDEGDVLWTTETADTLAAMPESIDLAARVTYFWKVEAQTEWRQWAASDLVEFRFGGRSR